MKKNKQSVDCHAAIETLKYWKGDLYLPANQMYTLIIDYPFGQPGKYKIKTKNGMGSVALLSAIYKAYIKQYTAANNGNNWYWHGIEDLCLERVNINHKDKLITLDVGS